MWQYLIKPSFRRFGQNAAFSLIKLSGLAVGMACFLLIALYIQNEWQYDAFHPKANRLYRISTPQYARTAPLLAPTLKKDLPEVESAVRMLRYFGVFRSDENRFTEERIFFAAPDALNMFHFEFTEGVPTGALDAPGQIILSESVARKYFGARSAVGRKLTIQDSTHLTVAGVFRDWPAGTHLKMDGLISFATRERNAAALNTWNNNVYYTYALLREGVQSVVFQQKLDDFTARNIRILPNREKYTLVAQGIRDIHLNSHKDMELEANGNTTALYVFMSIALFVLLIACINYINFSTALASKRAKEIGVRKSVGAGRGQLIRQFLGETLQSAFVALVLAVLITAGALPFLNKLIGGAIPVSALFEAPVLLFMLVFAFLTGVLAGAYPAFVLSSFRPAAVMKPSIALTGGIPRVRHALVVLQFALSFLLATGALTVIRQLDFLKNHALGFDKKHILVVPFNWDEKVQQQYDFLKEEWLRQPAVGAVTASGDIPGRMATIMSCWAEGMPKNETRSMQALYVHRDFEATYGLELVAGRRFENDAVADLREGYLLNERAVATLGWTNETALGKRFSALTEGKVIGVVKDFHFNALHQSVEPLYLAVLPAWCGYISLRLNTQDLKQTLSGIEKTWKNAVPDQPFDYYFLDDDFNRQYLAEVKLGKIVIVFSGLAFFIAMLGMLGLAIFTIERRTKEIGIRKVLGASVAGITALLAKDFLKLVVIAILIASPMAYYFMQKWLSDFAYHIELQWWIFAAAGASAVVIAFLTVGFQSVRAALANPVKSLQSE